MNLHEYQGKSILQKHGVTVQRGTRCCFRVDGVVLAAPPSCLAVRAVHLHDVDVFAHQMAREARAIGAGAFHADPHEGAGRPHPREQAPIALRRRRERRRAEDPPRGVDDRGDVEVLVRVDAARDALDVFSHAGICLPSLLRVMDRTTGRDGGQDTHGAGQGSYQVTFARPVGACPRPEPDRQISSKARDQSQTKGQTEPRPGTPPS